MGLEDSWPLTTLRPPPWSYVFMSSHGWLYPSCTLSYSRACQGPICGPGAPAKAADTQDACTQLHKALCPHVPTYTCTHMCNHTPVHLGGSCVFSCVIAWVRVPTRALWNTHILIVTLNSLLPLSGPHCSYLSSRENIDPCFSHLTGTLSGSN